MDITTMFVDFLSDVWLKEKDNRKSANVCHFLSSKKLYEWIPILMMQASLKSINKIW